MGAMSDPPLGEQLHRMKAQKVKRVCAEQSHRATQQSVEHALPEIFITGTTEIEAMKEKAPYRHIDNILTNMAEKQTLDKVFDCSIKR